MSLTDKNILSEFDRRAIQILEENKDHFLQYDALLGNEEFEADQDTVLSILNKYRRKDIDFAHLLGYAETGEYIGHIDIEGTEYEIYEDLFETDEGTNVIKKIFNLIDIEYKCKECLAQRDCGITEHRGECEGADELWNNQFINSIIKNILDFMWYDRLSMPRAPV
jgi:hypothetical protein